jgi:hypothetical protein
LSLALSLEGFEPISRRYLEIIEATRLVEVHAGWYHRPFRAIAKRPSPNPLPSLHACWVDPREPTPRLHTTHPLGLVHAASPIEAATRSIVQKAATLPML